MDGLADNRGRETKRESGAESIGAVKEDRPMALLEVWAGWEVVRRRQVVCGVD